MRRQIIRSPANYTADQSITDRVMVQQRPDSCTDMLLQGQKHVVEIHAEAVGIHRDGPAARPDYFLYNIGTYVYRLIVCVC